MRELWCVVLASSLLALILMRADLARSEDEPGRYRSVASALVACSGPVQSRQSTFLLWRHQYLFSAKQEYDKQDKILSGAPGRLLEIWESPPDLSGEPTLRMRTGYPFSMSIADTRATRCEGAGWLTTQKQLWLFMCSSFGRTAEISAYRVDLDVDMEHSVKMGAAADLHHSNWPRTAKPTATYVMQEGRGALRFGRLTVVPDGRGGFELALQAAGDSTLWVSFRPFLSEAKGRWRAHERPW